MYNYKLIIQYDGGRYKGFQRLANGENTIQSKLEQVLSQMLGKATEMIGCSRTDAGVHALAFVANFKTEIKFDTDKIKAYFNHYLPQDISITEVSEAAENYHARYLARKKTYLYKIWNKEYSNPFLRKYSMHVSDKLDIAAMEAAGSYFIGAHDFTAFSNAKSKKKSMIREIYDIDIKEEDGLVQIRITGNGFLYNMARFMVGTLVEVGLGRMKAEEITGILEDRIRDRTGDLADACGLYLEKVFY